MFLIIGATGNVGRATTQELRRRGLPVRVLTRDPSQASDLVALGAEVTVGDLRNPLTLQPAMHGVEKLLLATAPGPTLVAEQTAAVEAARRAGVAHIVRVSALGARRGAPVNLLDWHGRLDEVLRASGIPYTILHARWFMQNYLMQAASISSAGVFYGAMRDGRVAAVHAADVGRVASAVLHSAEPPSSELVVTGPLAMTQDEVAAALGRGIGREIRYVDVPPEALTGALQGAGLPSWLAAGIVGLQTLVAGGDADHTTDVVQRVAGVAPASVEAFAAAHAAVFQAAAEPASAA